MSPRPYSEAGVGISGGDTDLSPSPNGSWMRRDTSNPGTATHLLILASIFLAALGLRLYQLDVEPYNPDEIKQAQEVLAPLGDIVRLSYLHTQPPLDYLIGKAVAEIAGATDFTQRLPSALFGALAVVLLAHVLLRFGMPWAAIVAGALAAVDPLLVEYSQYARPYSIALFWVMATLALYQQWWLGDRGRVVIVLFALAATMAMLSRAVMPMLGLAVLGLMGRLEASRRFKARGLKEVFKSDPLAIAVLPTVFLFVWIPSFVGLATFGGEMLERDQFDLWRRLALFGDRIRDFGLSALGPDAILVSLTVVTLLVLVSSVRQELNRARYIWLPLLATAPLFVLVHSLTTQEGQFFAIRYMVFLPLGAAAYIGAATQGVLHRVRRFDARIRIPLSLIIAFSFMAVVLLTLQSTKSLLDKSETADWKSVAEYVERIEESDDVIVVIDVRTFQVPAFTYGFVASPRYYSGESPHLRPEEVFLEAGGPAESARRFHFVVVNPKLREGAAAPKEWTRAQFIQMLVLTTPELKTAEDRELAWWMMAEQLRDDVSVLTRLGGYALAERTLESGTGHPWKSAVSAQLEALGLSEFEDQIFATIILK